MPSHYGDILGVVIAREELSHEDTQTFAGWMIAYAAGAPGNAAMHAARAPVKPEP